MIVDTNIFKEKSPN